MTILQGLKVLDFSSLLPGPMATMMFADLGADVIHIESSNRVDLMRIMPPYDDEKESYIHQHINRSKRSLTLNLKTPEATEIIKKLIMEYDIIIEGFRPGVMQRLGLDYDTLRAINPKLIYCSITGYGQTGPFSNRPGHDNNYLSVAGLLDYSRHQNKKPVAMGMQIADTAGGALHAVVGVLSAALHREKTGKGQYVDVSMTDAVFSFNALAGATYFGSGHVAKAETEILNGGTFYDYYKTKDGRFFSVGSLEPQFRRLLCEALDIPELIHNSFNDSAYTQRRFKEAVHDAFLSKTFEEWRTIFNDDFHGCVEPVLTFEETCNHPQILAREMITTIDGQQQIASPIKFSDSPPVYKHKGAKLGEHNEEVLRSIGYTEETIQQLITKKILS